MRGSGTEADPYLVETLDDLDKVRDNPDACYLQVADIDASPTRNWRWNEDWEAYQGFKPIETFSGVYDGGGHSISNLYIDDWDTYVGLFGNAANAIIKNLTLYNPNISNRGYSWLPMYGTACIAASCKYSTSRGFEMINCHVHGGELKSRHPYIGGLVGDTTTSSNVHIRNCTVIGLKLGVFGSAYYAGGIGGFVSDQEIIDCHFVGEIIAVNPTQDTEMIGGIVGRFVTGNISRCSARGYISAEGVPEVGGISGNSGRLSDCYAHMDIVGGDQVGGLIGRGGSSITRCYYVGNISGDSDVGAIIGSIVGTPTVTSTYYDSDVVPVGSSVGEGKTTGEMMQKDTFTGWDFVNVWAIHEGQTYPMLRRGAADLGEPLTTRKAYIYVVEVDGPNQGSMLYDGKWYMYVKTLESTPPEKYPAGTQVTHTYGGDTLNFDGVEYCFLASGVQDPTAPGGYGSYTNETERTVEILPDRSNNVNFYYIILGDVAAIGYLEVDLGDQTALLPLADPDNPDLTTNAVRVAMPWGVGAAILVPPDSPRASLVRIALGGEIYGFQKA